MTPARWRCFLPPATIESVWRSKTVQAATHSRSKLPRSRPRAKDKLPPRARRLVAQSQRLGEEARLAAGRAAAFLRWELGFSAKEAAKALGVPVKEIPLLIQEIEDYVDRKDAEAALKEARLKGFVPFEEVKARLGL